MTSRAKPILIAGAGLSGCFMALLLARLGFRVVVYEQRPREEDSIAARRSINLALAPSTLRLLRETATLRGGLKALVTPLEGRVVHPVEGKPIFQPYAPQSAEATLLNPATGAASVSRAELNALLRSAAAEQRNVEFWFGERVVACDPERAVIAVKNSRGRRVSVEAEIIFAADGARSAIRQLLTRRRSGGMHEEQTTLRHCYKEIGFVPGQGLRKRALHIWPRAGFLLMALPNRDGSFRGAMFLPAKGATGFSRIKSGLDVQRFFKTHFPDAVSSVKNLSAQYAENPISSLISVTCEPWHVGRTVLIGDACHTLYPFSGQGANLALEDCVHLRRCIEEFAPNWERAFSEYTKSRKPKVDYLCEATRVMSALVLNAMPQEGIFGRV